MGRSGNLGETLAKRLRLGVLKAPTTDPYLEKEIRAAVPRSGLLQPGERWMGALRESSTGGRLRSEPSVARFRATLLATKLNSFWWGGIVE